MFFDVNSVDISDIPLLARKDVGFMVEPMFFKLTRDYVKNIAYSAE
jgi:hypothetical protein